MSLVLPLEDWPESDRQMWQALRAEGSPLDDRGALAHLRATTWQTLANCYGRWLCWITTNAPELLDLPPADRASLASLRGWLEDLAHTKPMSRLTFIDSVLRVLRAFGPDRDWSVQRRLLAGLKRTAGPATRSVNKGASCRARRCLRPGSSMPVPMPMPRQPRSKE